MQGHDCGWKLFTVRSPRASVAATFALVKAFSVLCGFIAVVAIGFAVWQRQQLSASRIENAALRAELDAPAAPSTGAADDSEQRNAELQRLRAESQELVRLRGEVTRLRLATNDTERLRAENRQLRSDNAQLRTSATAASPVPARAAGAGAVFPKSAWTFAGYKTPEDALVSAIWSMQQGNPRQYFDSLTPDEQARMTQAWEGKSPEEIAAKHRNDTAPINGIRVLQSDAASDTEHIITVLIGGVNRQERVRMQRIGEEWKFGGFIRESK